MPRCAARPPAPAVDLPDLIRFGGCELRIDSRELLLDGQPQVLEPRIFDLLVYLVRHRDRVVPHQELFDRIWSGAVVTENVIAHSVMKARKAIGDTVVRSSAIRTVHRVGYRFVGDLAVMAAAAPPRPPDAGHASPPHIAAAGFRLGVMPFANETGDPALDWVEQGLATMVCTALEDDTRLALVTPLQIAQARAAGPDRSAGTLPALARMLGLQGLVHAQLGRLRQGYALTYEGVGDGLAVVRGCIEGDEPTLLGQRMAQRIEIQLFPAAAVPVQFASSDPFVRENFARAMQAVSEQRWQSAAKLLQVVLDIEPHSLAAGIQQLRVFTALHDASALRLGPPLLARALQTGDPRQIATAHHALGHAMLNVGGPSDAARQHIEEAMRLADSFPRTDWVVSIMMTHALHETMSRRWHRARRLYAQVAQTCRENGNRLHLAKVLNNHANIDAVTGNLAGALANLEDAMTLCQDLGLESLVAGTACNQALLSADLGLSSRAARIAEQQVDAIASTQNPHVAASVMLSICNVLAATWKSEQMGAVLAAWQSRPDHSLASVAGYTCMAQGHHAAATGRLAAAADLMREAIAHMRRAGSLLRVEAWLPALLQVEMRRRDGPAIASVMADIEALAMPDAVDRQRGLLLHGRASLLHIAGDPAAALAALREAVDLLPAGALHANACFDAAWLHLEQGAVDAARRLLRGLTPWLDEHPVGLLVRARLEAAEGDFDQAQATYRGFMDNGGWRVTNEHLRAGEDYAAARLPRTAQALPSAA